MTESKTSWKYNLLKTNETKAAERVGVPKGLAWELIGADGSILGGVRPHPGFLFFKDLTGRLGAVDQDAKDTFHITFRVSATKYAYGTVYRVKEDSSTNCKYFLEYRIGQDLTWNGPVDLVGTKTNGDAQMNVTIFGRFVYVMVSGSEPFVFYIDEDPPGTFTLKTVTDTGPGNAPEIHPQAYHIGSAQEDLTNIFSTFVPPGDADGTARFLFFDFCDSSATDAKQSTVNPPAAGTPIEGPSDLGLWASPPQADPTFYDLASPTEVGRWWQDIGTGDDDPRPVVLDGAGPVANFDNFFAFAYVLYDSRTGRKSQPSPIKVFTNSVHTLSNIQSAAGPAGDTQPILFPCVDVIYESDKYDTLLVYRSMSLTSTSSQPPKDTDFLLKLDSTITLSDYLTDTQPTAPWKRAVYFLRLSDEELALQDNFPDDNVFLDNMPTGGSSLFYEKTMLVGKTGTFDTQVGGLGTMYWSDLLELSVELFKSDDQYLMTVPDEEVERFLRLGPSVLAMTKQGLYLVRRQTTTLQVYPLQDAFGIVGARAACLVGSNVWYMTHQGVKVVNPDGAVASIDAMNQIAQDAWASTITSVEMAYDAVMNAIVVLNPALGRCVFMWVETGQMTELYDCPFTHVSEGNVPYDATQDSPLQKRAVFTQPLDSIGDETGWTWRLFTVDYARQKDNILMLDPTGPFEMTATADFVGGTTLTVTAAGFGGRLEGCKVYALSGTQVGQCATIAQRFNGTTLTLHSDAAALVGVKVGDRLGISPVYFRWVGCQLGIESETGEQFADPTDQFYTRTVDALGCAFADVVDGTAEKGQKDARFRALLYKGTEEDPVTTAFPVSLDGDKVISVEDGPGTYYAALGSQADSDGVTAPGYQAACLFPGVEIFTPGLDFRLLGVMVTGNIRDSQASGKLRT